MRGQWLTIVLAAAALAPTGCPPPEPAPITDFSESRPAWDMPELAVTGLVVEPERANPGDVTLMRATVVNRGSGASDPAGLVFLADGQPVGRATLGRLEPGQEVERRAEARIRGEGIHIVRAELELAEGAFDASHTNNFRIARARIAGARDPEPELEFAPIDFDAMQLAPGGTYRIPVRVHNPGFAPIGRLPAGFLVDGETMARTVIGPLGPGESQELNLTWPVVTPGEHVLALRMELPERFPFARHQSFQSWHVAVPDVTVLSDSVGKDKWASVGPRQLEEGWPAGSVGRMDAIAIHPTNSDILYACSPSGGIWKSTDGGGHWTPLGDKLEKMGCSGVAIDPQKPSVVYFTTGHPLYRGGWGVYKSVDSGVTWKQFATQATEVTDTLATNVFTIEGAYRPVVRYTSSGQVLIYLASNHGVLRYTSSNPSAVSSTASEWVMIKSGIISDLVVSPSNPALLYAAVHRSGVFRTSQGVTLPSYKHSTYWTALTSGLPDLSAASRWVTLDLGPPASSQLYAGISNPPAVPPDTTKFSVYRLLGDTNAWLLGGASSTADIYNPFLRCHPTDVGVVYFGGVKLYKKWMFMWMLFFPEVQIANIHDDMKDLQFFPNDPTRYYLLSDGGVFRCTVGSPWTQSDTCVPRNYDLRVTQFYDLDTAPNNAFLMIGGTQDNGTIIWNGQPDWSTFHIFNYGDGYHSLIAPKNPQVMYAQFQSLDSTARSADGGKTWSKASNGLPAGWNMNKGYITAHPNSADYVLSQGDQVYATFDGGQNWTARGPKGSNVKGQVTKVLVQPTTFTWIAGTSQGQLWSTSTAGSPWSLEFEHPYGASVASMAFAPTDHRVLLVSFAAGGANAYTRLWRFEINPGPPVVWTASDITDNFPTQRTARVISGDGYSTEVAYIGTERGVFRGKTTSGCGSCVWNWQPYNSGLPLVQINDLLVDPASKQLRAGTWGRGAWAVITGP